MHLCPYCRGKGYKVEHDTMVTVFTCGLSWIIRSLLESNRLDSPCRVCNGKGTI